MIHVNYCSQHIVIPNELQVPYIPKSEHTDTVPNLIVRHGQYTNSQYQKELKEFPSHVIDMPKHPLLTIQRIEDRVTFEMKDIGLFNFVDPHTIEVTLYTDDHYKIAHFFWGNIFTAYLAWKGYFVLHANTVILNDKAYVFMGESGAGKSTLTTYLSQNGFDLLSDDITVVKKSNGAYTVIPGKQEVRLFPESVNELQFSTANVHRHVEKEGRTKYCYVLPTIFSQEEYPIEALFFLRPDQACTSRLASGIQKFQNIMNSIFVFSQPKYSADYVTQFEEISNFINSTPLYDLTRTHSFTSLSHIMEMLKHKQY